MHLSVLSDTLNVVLIDNMRMDYIYFLKLIHQKWLGYNLHNLLCIIPRCYWRIVESEAVFMNMNMHICLHAFITLKCHHKLCLWACYASAYCLFAWRSLLRSCARCSSPLCVCARVCVLVCMCVVHSAPVFPGCVIMEPVMHCVLANGNKRNSAALGDEAH